jgi:hypothetical protein
MSKKDLKRYTSEVIKGSMLGLGLPSAAIILVGKAAHPPLRWWCDWTCRIYERADQWGSPERYGKAPPRARKLFYRRRTVERLCERIEDLNTIIDRQQQKLYPPGSSSS